MGLSLARTLIKSDIWQNGLWNSKH